METQKNQFNFREPTRWVFILLILSFFASTVFADDLWIKSLKKVSRADRQKLPTQPAHKIKSFGKPAVFMKHATVILDKKHMPTFKKKDGHIFLQLTKCLNPSIEKKLKDHNVELLEYLPSNTWKARIPVSALSEVKSLGFVYAMGNIHPEDKFPKHILDKGFSLYSHHQDGTVSVLVTFHKDTLFSQVKKLLSELSAITDQKNFISGKRVLLRIPQNKIETLASTDEVNWIENRPTPKRNHNSVAAALSNIDDLQSAPYNLNGSGVNIGMWDEGEVQANHPDLAGRVTIVDASTVDNHATHVAGTIIGDGSGNPDAKGMAPSANLFSYDYNGDVPSEMVSSVSAHAVVLSNNSWGFITGWQDDFDNTGKWVWWGDTGFGVYDSDAQAWDDVILVTNLITINSAGNDRNDTGDQLQIGHYHGNNKITIYRDLHPPDPNYTSIGTLGSSKNIITVGAVDDSGSMSDFSSWGPTDDGRIKPDIVANGVGLTSTCPINGYCGMSGTSMSSPVVTGAIALVVQQYVNKYNAMPSPSMVKALLINTATDFGPDPGPDYKHGWGLLNASAAVDLIEDANIHLGTNLLSAGNTVKYEIAVPTSTPNLKVTIAWTDPPGTPGAAKALINDIDIELVDPNTFLHLPWKLDPSYPSMKAVQFSNSVDNVEQVEVLNPQEGLWIVYVRGISIQSTQSFSIVSNLLLNAGRVNLPKTGQITCYDEIGTVIPCAGTAQDGDVQAGVEWPSPRFVDNGDGTVTDNLTGLIWLKNAGRFVARTWSQALNDCKTLSDDGVTLTDGSVSDEWRLPNILELASLFNVESSNNGTWLISQGFTNVQWQSSYYWSATTYPKNMYYGGSYVCQMGTSSVSAYPKTDKHFVWPVRAGRTGPVQTWKTGQTISYSVGDDGDIQAGIEWPSPRFFDKGDGTVTDNLTGLVWLKNASRFVARTWSQALNDSKSLTDDGVNLTDGSVAGDWRLPNDKELFSLIDYSMYDPALPQGHPFMNVQSTYYWSGTTHAPASSDANVIAMGIGTSLGYNKLTGNHYVWPVRGGFFEFLDSDGDGLSNSAESISCTDLYDADTDDDGINDGVEDANQNIAVDTGETNPCKADTDGDGIQDGTELGLTSGHATDTNSKVFIPDADGGATTTNPLDPDSDNDDFKDGREDKNHNGRIDKGESDPNDAMSKPVIAMPWIPLLLLDN